MIINFLEVSSCCDNCLFSHSAENSMRSQFQDFRCSSQWTGFLFGKRVKKSRFFHPFPNLRACWQAIVAETNVYFGPTLICGICHICPLFFPRWYTTNPRHRNSASESDTATTSQFRFVQIRDQINNNIPSICVSYLFQLHRIFNCLNMTLGYW